MKPTSSTFRSHERWAHFGFSVIGPLLAAPPSRGQLQPSSRNWRPKNGSTRFREPGWSRAFHPQAVVLPSAPFKAGPVAALKRKIRSDHGQHPSVSSPLIELLIQQHRQHPGWSFRLPFDNLAVVVEQQPQACGARLLCRWGPG